ncbi:MAG: hypothetical protein U5R30_15185 [Deltaproteobacteria bacterium]|nr:hypothetical protein [Deltaproteobacteria bacterium]
MNQFVVVIPEGAHGIVVGVVHLPGKGQAGLPGQQGIGLEVPGADMGAYEHGDICECDYLGDLDTDGADLAEYIDNLEAQSLSLLAEDYGRTDCPTYAFTP